MANKFILKRSSVANKVPLAADLDIGELAVNTADGKLFVKLADGSVAQIGGSGGGSVAVVRRSQLITESGTWDRPTGMVGNVVRLTQIGGGASCRPSATVTARVWHS